jgi:putative transposase
VHSLSIAKKVPFTFTSATSTPPTRATIAVHKHNPGRVAYWHGSERGGVTLGGRKVRVERPRVRTTDGTEVALPLWQAATDTDLMSEHMVAAMLAGVSCRQYQQVALEPVGELAASGVGRSSVSARFVTATAARLVELRGRDLSGRRWLVVFVDGFDFAGQTMVGALGVSADGTKVPLGVVQGTTENTTICKQLLRSAKDRGLDASDGILFVIDGGKVLAKAIRDLFDGDPFQIARCHQHKERNVIDHVARTEHAWVRRELRAAWKLTDAHAAKKALETLVRKLERINPDAAASLGEGLDETLTIIRLGVTGTLAKTVATRTRWSPRSTSCVSTHGT